MKPLRFGIVGFGQIAEKVHLPVLKALVGVDVAAIAEANPQRRAVAGQQAPASTLFEDYMDMLNNAQLDAVVICLPTALHMQASLAAFDHGLHVYLEKPMALSLDEARQIKAAWQRAGRVGMIGFNYRYNPLNQAARQYLAQGRLGTLVAIRTEFSTPSNDNGWRQSRASGGGALLELGSHHIDLVQYLTGRPVSNISATIHSAQSQDDQVFLQFELSDGPLVQSSFYTGLGDRDRLEVRGTSAGLNLDRYLSLSVELVDNIHLLNRKDILLRRARSLQHLPYLFQKRSAPSQELSYQRALEAFVGHIANPILDIPNLDDGYECMRVIAAAERSAQMRRSVSLTEID